MPFPSKNVQEAKHACPEQDSKNNGDLMRYDS